MAITPERTVPRRLSPPQLALLVLLGVSLLELEGFRFRRSEAAIDVARFLASRDNVRNVTMEEGTTTTGATLYLRPTIQVVSLGTCAVWAKPHISGAWFRGPEAQYVVLRESSPAPAFRDLLRQAGYIRVRRFPEGKRGERYRIFVRRTE